jgi:SAM-dependent methyltransferase
MLAYYSASAREDFWTEHWGGHTVDELLAVAEASPLTSLIVGAIPPHGLVLEAGCGLGQYVILLRQRGWRVAGVDTSVPALTAARRWDRVPLLASDLRNLAVRTGAVATYVSLGVVEHDPDGPGAILAEARRVLAPGGVLLISVPYLNGMRRVGAPWIRRRQAALRRRGATFYQYAFTRRELLVALRGHGFTPIETHPYDPARLPRGAWRRARGAVGAMLARPAVRPPSREPASPEPGGASRQPRSTAPTPAHPARGALSGIVRRALYTPLGLRMLGHMLLVVARRS